MDPLPIFSAAFSALLCALETNLIGNANRFLSSLTSSSRTYVLTKRERKERFMHRKEVT